MIPLKVITEYSLQKSLIKIPDLINFLKQNNISTCSICDDELFGVIEFYNLCKQNNIKPLLAFEVQIGDITYYLYAKNYQGYLKLLKINTLKYQNKLTTNEILDINILVVIPYKYYDKYNEIKSKNVYLSYQNNTQKQNALLITNNILYINNIRCINKEDIPYLRYLKQINNKLEYTDNDYFIINNDLDDNKRINDFSALINIELPFNGKYIPNYKIGINSSKYLEKLAYTGLAKRLNGTNHDKYESRLKEELRVINEMDFANYFLIVYDYVLYAKKNNIMVGPGRGSACGSLISYAIGITDIDPIKYDLLFSRFLNPYRKKMPDIDIDFEDTKRNMVISYVRNKYGNDKVALGLTFNSYKSKLIIREIAKILKIEDNLLNKFIKVIDSKKNLLQNKQNKYVQKYLQMYPRLNKLYDICLHLENLKKNVSTHAAGVVISSCPVDDVIPTYLDNDILKTGITMDYLENLGLLKMDFLALSNLTLIKNITSKIPNFDINRINLDDEKVYQLFKDANTDYIFQFESNYAKEKLLQLKVSSFKELIIAMALVRPGASNQIEMYIKNKNNPNLEIHPNLKSILQSTYGVIIFQEQVINILQVIAGYNPYEADSIRIAISKKKEDIILKEENKFISNAIKNGYKKEFAQNIYNQIKRFAEYGFNKSHSVAYSLTSFRLAYLKVYYPIIFYTVIIKDAKDISKNNILNELKKLNIRILKPNLNYSNCEYQFKNNNLLLPFNMIKGLNNNIIKEILLNRDELYSDIFTFCYKCQNILNRNTYDIFVKSDIFKIFNYNHRTLMENKDIIFNYIELNDINADKPIIEVYPEYDKNYLEQEEKECYGFYITNHPCSIYQKVIKIKDSEKYLFKKIDMILLVEKIKKIKTKKGDDMAFITASDETGSVELTLFPREFMMVDNLKVNDLILINGKPSKRYDKFMINVNQIKKVNNNE